MKKRIVTIISAMIVLWLAMGITDFVRVTALYRSPWFCRIHGPSYDDGGSGEYVGLGYSFDIEGDFITCADSVTKYTAKIFGVTVGEGQR